MTDVESYLTGYMNKAAYYRYNNRKYLSRIAAQMERVLTVRT
jgi:hypothetical protein